MFADKIYADNYLEDSFTKFIKIHYTQFEDPASNDLEKQINIITKS